MAIYSGVFPLKMVIFHSFLYVYQRVDFLIQTFLEGDFFPVKVRRFFLRGIAMTWSSERSVAGRGSHPRCSNRQDGLFFSVDLWLVVGWMMVGWFRFNDWLVVKKHLEKWWSSSMGRMTSHIPNSVGKSQLWLVESICSLVKSTHRLVDHVNIHVCWLKPHFFGFNTSFFSWLLDCHTFLMVTRSVRI